MQPLDFGTQKGPAPPVLQYEAVVPAAFVRRRSQDHVTAAPVGLQFCIPSPLLLVGGGGGGGGVHPKRLLMTTGITFQNINSLDSRCLKKIQWCEFQVLLGWLLKDLVFQNYHGNPNLPCLCCFDPILRTDPPRQITVVIGISRMIGPTPAASLLACNLSPMMRSNQVSYIPGARLCPLTWRRVGWNHKDEWGAFSRWGLWWLFLELKVEKLDQTCWLQIYKFQMLRLFHGSFAVWC